MSAPAQSASSAPSRRDRLLSLLVPGYAEHLGATLWLLFFARIINAFAFSGAFPFLARYLAHDRALAATAVGAVYMAQGVVGALFQVIGGELTDRFGRRPVLVGSLLSRAFLTLGLGALIHVHAAVWLIALVIVVNAMLAGIFQPAADALVIDVTRPEQRIQAFAHQRVAINVGWTLGPMLGGLIAAGTSIELLFALASPLVLVGAFLFSRLPEPAERRPPPKRTNPFAALKGSLDDTGLRLQLLGALLVFTMAGQLVVTLSVDTASRLALDERHLGYLWTLNGVLVVAAQMPVARLVRRLGTKNALVAGALLYGLFYAAMGFATGFWHLVACMIGVTCGELLNAPSQQTAIAQRATPETMGRALGLLGLMMMLGRSFGPLVGGAAHDAYGAEPRTMWCLIGAIGVIAALLYLHPAVRCSTSAQQPEEEEPEAKELPIT